MILFFNVLVTDVRSSVGGMNRADRLDIFKYALASYACIDRITDVIIYCQLDGGYASRESELRDYVNLIFDGKRIEYNNESAAYQNEWKRLLTNSPLLTTDQPILYMGNDDHIFIDYDLGVLYEGLDLMAKEPADQINTIHFTSWTEGVSTIYGLNEFETVGRYWITELFYPDACQIVNSTFFKHIFFDLDIGNDYMRRTDNILTNFYPTLGDYKYPSNATHPKVKTFLPLRELVRHFDAYWHIEVPLEYCPMLNIPEGFFKSKIRIGPHDSNPPLFWKNKIIEVNGSPLDSPERLETGNKAHRLAMIAPHNRGYQNPFCRCPARKENKWRDLGRGELLLEEKYIEIGYR